MGYHYSAKTRTVACHDVLFMSLVNILMRCSLANDTCADCYLKDRCVNWWDSGPSVVKPDNYLLSSRRYSLYLSEFHQMTKNGH